MAIDSGQYDLTLLLLCNGYRTELEPESPLDLALQKRAWDFVDLLLAWGADPTAASPYSVLDTYQTELMERFWDLGLDLTRDQSLAHYLADTTSNKPAYGWAKRHSKDPRVARALTLALGEAVWEEREKAVALLVWAGADPHRRVVSLRDSMEADETDEDGRSAIELAVLFAHGGLLKYLAPGPSRDDFEELWEWVSDATTADVMFDLCPPRDWSKTIRRNVSRMASRWGSHWESRRCLERIFEHFWGRLTNLDPSDCQDMRRDLLKIEDSSDFAWLLRKLARPHHCGERIFRELTRTQTIRERMAQLKLDGLLRSQPTTADAGATAGQRKGHPAYEKARYGQAWLQGLSPSHREAVLRDLISREQLYAEI